MIIVFNILAIIVIFNSGNLDRIALIQCPGGPLAGDDGDDNDDGEDGGYDGDVNVSPIEMMKNTKRKILN